MEPQTPLNLFYEEPDPDRWVPLDRYPRRLIRRLWRGPWQPSGHMRVLLNLMAGLDRIGAAYRINDYRYARSNPEGLVGLIGKPHLLKLFPATTPLLFGPSIYNHPLDDESLPYRHAVRQVLVPSPWVRDMFSTVWPGIVTAWPVGIDVQRWAPAATGSKDIDILVYDKIFRDRGKIEDSIIKPLIEEFRRRGLVVAELRYGSYFERQLLSLSRRARAMVYFSRHETQGIALQQMLASDVPVFAWDPGGQWQNLEYLLRGVRWEPVTSVPYWDDRCGVKFATAADMLPAFDRFWRGVVAGSYAPREMVLERKLTLEGCAQAYVDLSRKYGAVA